MAGSVRIPAHFCGIYTIKCNSIDDLTNIRFYGTIPKGWERVEYARAGRCESLLFSHDPIAGLSFVLFESCYRSETMGL